jgi:hypothetical protein
MRFKNRIRLIVAKRRVRRFVRRNPLPLVALVVIAGALIGVGVRQRCAR